MGLGLVACNGERDMSTETTETPELREVATLAYRALEDAYRVISTIDGDDTHEQWELDLLSKRVKDVATSLFVTLRSPHGLRADSMALERPKPVGRHPGGCPTCLNSDCEVRDNTDTSLCPTHSSLAAAKRSG